MTLEDLPDELRVTELPESIQETLAYLAYRDSLVDDGVPLSEVPGYPEWKAARHG
jgi:hypothetical protein